MCKYILCIQTIKITMAIISTYPKAIATSNDLLVGTQVSTAGTQINPTKNFTIDSIRDLVGRYLVTGLVNNLGSQASGLDFMEWTSNVTSDTQIPIIKLPTDVELVSIAFTWMGDTALVIGPGDQIAFGIGTVPSGSNPIIGNYTETIPLFTLTQADNGTYANNIVANLNQKFNAGEQLAVVGQETGAVTPNTGELSITLLFKSL